MIGGKWGSGKELERKRWEWEEKVCGGRKGDWMMGGKEGIKWEELEGKRREREEKAGKDKE